MLLAQAERFAELTAFEEARARARQVIAYCELECERESESHIREEIAMRERLAEVLMKKLGRNVRDMNGRLRVHSDDADVPQTWD